MDIAVKKGALARLGDRFGLTARVVASGIVATTLGVVALTGWAVKSYEKRAFAEAQESLEANLRLLKHEVGRVGQGFAVDGDKLTVAGQPLNGRNDIVDAVKTVTGGVATLFLGDLRVATNVTRPDGSRGVGTRLAPGVAFEASITRGQTYRGRNVILGRDHLTIYEPIRDASGRQVGLWFVGVPVDQIAAAVRAELLRLATVGAVALILAGLLVGLATRTSLAPLRQLAVATRKVSEGDFAAVVPGKERNDQVGDLARAVATLQAEAAAAAEARAEAERARIRASEERHEMRLRMAEGFEAQVMTVVRQTADAVRTLEGTAARIAENARRNVALSGSVADAAGEAAGSVNGAAAAAEELSASISEISRQVAQAASVASAAVSEATRTNASVDELAGAASRIGDVVRLIGDIAGQTNLRHDRGRARGRGGQGLRGRRLRGEEPRRADGQGDGGDRCSDHLHAGRDRRCGQRDQADRGADRGDLVARLLDRRGGGGAGGGDIGDRALGAAGGERHLARLEPDQRGERQRLGRCRGKRAGARGRDGAAAAERRPRRRGGRVPRPASRSVRTARLSPGG